jgi:outer membrane receptor for ferrienterochelin and colicins
MKALITSLCTLLWMGMAWAQGTGSLAGKVSDAEGVGVPQANVVVAGPNVQGTIGATSDEKGSFEIGGVPSGVYTVTVTHIGFKEEVLEGVQVEVGKQVALDFRLESQVIFLNQQVVSASRRQEKVLDAPASVSVVEAEEIQNNPTLSVIEHVKDLPGVDFAQYGLVQNSVVVRGFNNIFSGALLSMTDNRIARVPSLRVNSYNFIPVTNDDVERIEVVLGPGAALYGPNSANGVMHVITRSPLTSVGTNVNVGLGERSLRMASVRHAGTVSDKLGYKISAQYYTGEDWEAYDSEESAQGKLDGGYLYRVTVDGDSLYSQRDFDIDRQSAELRLDYQPTDELSAILSAGYNNGTFIEQTGLGAGQATDWSYNYVQARLLYRDWFAQVYRNWSDAGDTFLLRSGADIVDKSSLTVFQAQHMAHLGQRQRFTYGFDALLTRPDTEGTISGQNEEDDDINEIGAYLQSETALTDKLDLVLALRYDDHNRVEDAELSPRAALVFKPQSDQTVRLTYNRAFSTPTTNNLYLDLVSKPDAFGIGAAFAPSLGFAPNIDIRAQGTYRTGFDEGFTFKRDASGDPMYRTPFAPVIQAQLGALGMTPETPGYPIDADGYISLDNPLATGVMWGIGRQAVLAEFGPMFEPLATQLIAQQMIAAGMTQADALAAAQVQAAALAAGLPSIIPAQLSGLTNDLLRLSLEKVTAGDANPFVSDSTSNIIDVPRTKSTITKTYELGYKGVIGGKLVIAADAYRTVTENFVGPLAVETPNVFLDGQVLGAALGQEIGAALADPANAALAQGLAALDAVQLPGVVEGNSNGTPVDELAGLFAAGAAQIPFGTVSPEQAYDPNAVIVTYRNFGEVTINGLDLSLAYYPTDRLMLNGNFSYVDDNFFENLDGIADVTLNAPKMKFKMGASYTLPGIDLTVGGKMRYADSFKMQSGVYHGTVDSYTVFDMSLGYRPPIEPPISVRLDVSNLLDNVHREFVGGAEIGRLVFCQVGVSF